MKYKDISYPEKRKILRQFYVNNGDAHKSVKTLAFAVKEKLTNPIVSSLMDYDTIIDYLIDGYLAYEILNDTYLMQLDPIKLLCTWSSERGAYWECNNGNTLAMTTLDINKVLYISYYLSETSFLSSVYEGLIDANDEKFILSHVDFVIDRFSNKKLKYDEILNVDKILLRGLKVQKLKKEEHE